MVNNHDEMAANLARLSMMFQRIVNGHEKYPNGNIQFCLSFSNVLSLSYLKSNDKISRFYSSADWYKGILTDKQLDDLENPPTTTQKPKVKKVSSRRKHQRLPQREQAEEESAAAEE